MVSEVFVHTIVSESLFHLFIHWTLDVIIDFERPLTGFVSLRWI